MRKVSILVKIHLIARKAPFPHRMNLICRKISDTKCPVIVDSNVIRSAPFEYLLIPILRGRHNITLFKIPPVVSRISAILMHVQTVFRLKPIIVRRSPHILRTGCFRIGTAGRHGRAYLSSGNQLMACLYGQGMGQKHMIIHLGPEPVCLPFIRGINIHPLIHPHHQVLFIVDLPVFNPVAKSPEAYPGIPFKGQDTPA